VGARQRRTAVGGRRFGYGAAVPDPTGVAPAQGIGHGAPATPWGWILATTMLCFLPLGLVAIGFGLRADRARQANDPARCQRAVRACRGWIIATIVIGLTVDGIIAATLLLLGAFPR
jgi:hypothetical protein